MPYYDLVVDVLSIIFGCVLFLVLIFGVIYSFIYMLKSERMKSEYIKKLKDAHQDDVVAAICYYNHCRPSFSEVFKKDGKKE